MKLNRLFGPAIVLGLSILAGCGIGVAGSGGGAGGPTPPPGPSITFHGTVYQLAGSLAHATQSCIPAGPTPPPSPCPNNPPPASPTPAPGPPLAGVKIFVTTSSGELVTGIPNNPVASTTTAADGTFAVTVPTGAFPSGKAGLMVVNGTSISLASGLTDLGYMVEHTEAPVTNATVGPFYLDTISGDEAVGMARLEQLRKTFGLSPVIFDELAEEAIRYGAFNDVPMNTGGCGSQGKTNIFYQALGGFAVGNGFGVTFNSPDWGTAMNTIFGNLHVGSSPKDVFAGIAGPVYTQSCGLPGTNVRTYYNLFALKSA